MTLPSTLPFAQQPLKRATLLTLVRTALTVGEAHYAQRAALAWLAAYPGDLLISLLQAQALYQGGSPKSALTIIEGLITADPEFFEAQDLLTSVQKAIGDPLAGETAGNVLALGGAPDPRIPLPKGAHALQRARQSLARGSLAEAEALVHQVLPTNPVHPLGAVTHLRVLYASRKLPTQAICSLAQSYHERWPDCLLFMLILADTLMEGGESDMAVALLHQAAAKDVAGQIPNRLWGTGHPYASLWPEMLEIQAFGPTSPQEIPIPAAVAAVMGWNLLTGGSDQQSAVSSQRSVASYQLSVISDQSTVNDQPSTVNRQPSTIHGQPSTVNRQPPPAEIPETLRPIQAELEKVAASLKKPYLAHSDGRFPVYVVLCTRLGLETQYGAEGAARLDDSLRRLAAAVRTRNGWNAIVFYADDAACMAEYNLTPARHNDAWTIKLALADLDAVLRKRGQMIGALLIVGGPEIVPFHRLPNPVDDADAEVPSDNPYGTRDENYFIPEWPVGRLPGGAGSDPDPLWHLLRELAALHVEQARRAPWYRRLLERAASLFKKNSQTRASLGYTAEIWRRASLSVFHPIGDPRGLLVSPPVTVEPGKGMCDQRTGLPVNVFFPKSRLGYFNLHGVVDSAEWYGQRDPLESESGADYPVALRPEDLGNTNHRTDTNHRGDVNHGYTPKVVFSEACYGAHIIGRNIEETLALKFLTSGSQAVVGSTVTAYGSVTTPLIAADLLGIAFWSYLREGIPAGEALRRAKIHLAKEMHRRQGYLDGEDQKTLISFVLYGDPLAQPMGQPRTPKAILRPLTTPTTIKVVCDRAETDLPAPVPAEVMAHVKHVVAQYLPGMADATVALAHEKSECHDGGHTCPTSQFGAKSRPAHAPSRQVVTLSKRVEQAAHVHRHYARLTLDAQGKLVKLVVSR